MNGTYTDPELRQAISQLEQHYGPMIVEACEGWQIVGGCSNDIERVETLRETTHVFSPAHLIQLWNNDPQRPANREFDKIRNELLGVRC